MTASKSWGNLPDQIKIIDDFISEDEERELLGQMPPVKRVVRPEGRVLVNRMFKAFYLPPWLEERLKRRLPKFTNDPFGYVVEYLPGNGIEMHTDYRRIGKATHVISLGAPCMHVWRPGKKFATPGTHLDPRDEYPDNGYITLQPRSSVSFWDDAWLNWLHGVQPVKAIRYALVLWPYDYMCDMVGDKDIGGWIDGSYKFQDNHVTRSKQKMRQWANKSGTVDATEFIKRGKKNDS